MKVQISVGLGVSVRLGVTAEEAGRRAGECDRICVRLGMGVIGVAVKERCSQPIPRSNTGPTAK